MTTEAVYILHLDWDDFIAQATGQMTVFVEGYVEPAIVQNIHAGNKEYIQCAYEDSNGRIHAARIFVEHVNLWGYQAPPEGVDTRFVQAMDLVKQAIWRAHLDVQHGLLLVPGLREDLKTITTAHRLWGWKNARDPENRKLIPA